MSENGESNEFDHFSAPKDVIHLPNTDLWTPDAA
jgi:hypothetical protein